MSGASAAPGASPAPTPSSSLARPRPGRRATLRGGRGCGTVRLAAAMCAACAVSCASTAAVPERLPEHGEGVLVVDDAARTQWSAPATFTVRSVGASGAERVVGLPGLGEIHVGFGGDDDACRFVWSKGGLDRLVLFTARACAERVRSRVCFHAARFDRAAEPADDAPVRLVVDGCADENELLWSKVDGRQPATVGPTAFRQRCAPVPHRKRCALVYLKKRRIYVDSNDAPDQGFAFSWDGDGWRACFLEKESGRYDIDLDVEDECGHASSLVLRGDSADLED